MKSIILLSILALVAVQAVDLDHKYSLTNPTGPVSDADALKLYGEFLIEFKGISVSNLMESPTRFLNFKKTLDKIVKHNSDEENTWKMGINKFSDLTDEEFNAQYLMQEEQECSATKGTFKLTAEEKQRKAPKHHDWRSFNVVSEVKNQGSCGSCWTFSSTGCLESHFALHTGTSPRLLSEQQLVDCAYNFDNNGCKGGLPSHAFEYIKYAGGLNTAEAYPYEAIDTKECRFDPLSHGAVVRGGAINITARDEDEQTQAIAFRGPVAVAFQVVTDFRDYRSGVYSSKVCKDGEFDVNHAVLAVGFGTDDKTKQDFYLIKNSWGPQWGEEGYFKILRGKNMCGIATCSSIPDITGEGLKLKEVISTYEILA